MAEQKPEYIEYWSQRWEEGRTGWHSKDVNEFLVKFYPQVTGKDLPSTALLDPSSEEFQENSKKTWFVPLCGKTVDIPFLLGLGYRVFGVDGVKKAIETLDAENKLDLKFDEARSVYEGAGGKLKIYCGDLFKCPIEEFGPFDFCWDRGSLIAIEYSQRLLYRNMLQRAFAASNTNKILLCNFYNFMLLSFRYFVLHFCFRLQIKISHIC